MVGGSFAPMSVMPKPIDQILAEFPGDVRRPLGAVAPFGIILEQIGVVMAHHRGAASRRRDDHLGVGEGRQKLFGDGAGVVLKAGVERHLPAAGLVERKAHLDAEMFENFHHRNAGVRVDHIDDAGHKQRDGFVERRRVAILQPSIFPENPFAGIITAVGSPQMEWYAAERVQ